MTTPIDKWWPIGLGITAIVLYVIGGGLFGAWNNSIYCGYDYDDYYECFGNVGYWNGGVALCSLGGFASFAWLIVLILYLMRRNKAPSHAPPTEYNINYNYNTTPEVQPQAPVQEVVPPKGGMKEGHRFCAQCGNSIQTPFCPRCGGSAV
jgi:hypothetical protein